MPAEIKEKTLEAGLVTINYAETPSAGTPLVLLHGGSATWQSFESIMAELAARWHIYAPDFRGHGKSSWAPGTYRLQDYASDILTFLRECVKEPVHLFGHSLGGIVALLVAAQYSEGVRAVAVGDAPLTSETWRAVLELHRERALAWRDLAGGQKSYEEVIEELKDAPIEVPGRPGTVPMREVVGEDAPVYAWVANNLLQNDPDMHTALYDRYKITAAGYEMTSVLPAIHCPVLLLQADPETGGLMTDREVELALPLLAQPRHVRLSGISHVLHNERKEPVLEALIGFFATMD
jgi:pimeloyl-ACP methyl ester carboxylesterase